MVNSAARVSDLTAAMDRITPLALAEPWDNAGLILGDPNDTLDAVLLTIDLTDEVLEEALEHGARAIVAYHPPIWEPLRRVRAHVGTEHIIHRAVRAGVSVYSPHTAADAAPDGTTDWLADGVIDPQPGTAGGADRRALEPAANPREHADVKIVTFVPEPDLDRVRSALASAGAGHIGEYELCSYVSPGHGTFKGSERSNPAVGTPGSFETAPELRLEMVCPRKALPLALETLRSFHPYEEPAVDVYELVTKPQRRTGTGRRLMLDHPASIETIANRLKAHLGVPTVKIAPAAGKDPSSEVSTIGLCPGAGAPLAPVALADGCELFVTGEMKHHEVKEAVAEGLSIILAGHTSTERGYLPRLKHRLQAELQGVAVHVSAKDKSPLRVV